MAKTPIILKGTAHGILLKPMTENWDDVLVALERALEDAEDFFRGGRVIMDVEDHHLTQGELGAVRATLNRFDIELWAILSEREETVRLARSNGVLTRLPKNTEPHRREEEAPPHQKAIFVQQTLRSGQSLQYPGHITLVGDVNPGAEVIAGGNIIIWGRIRGVAHAGAFGDDQAVICALNLQPSQLRIGSHISRTPDQRRRTIQPEMARVEDDQIVAEPWNKRG
jgi:septum site-determining protein MinC